MITAASDTATFTLATFYNFAPIDDPSAFRDALLTVVTPWDESHQLRGTLHVANEGVNGSIAGTAASLEAVIQWLAQQPGFERFNPRFYPLSRQVFGQMKVKLKNEIVSFGHDTHPLHDPVGIAVPPAEWNTLLEDPSVVVVDTRNDYEVEIGTFAHATNPNIQHFTQFADFVNAQYSPETHPKVAMFCTGGVRCEKASAYMKKLGYPTIYQLEGGILNYLKAISPEDSLWQGECFVFDERVSVNHTLEEGQYAWDTEAAKAIPKPLPTPGLARPS